VVLHLKEQPEHLIPLHPLQDIRIRADMPMEEMYGGTQQLLLQGTEALSGFTIPGYCSGTQAMSAVSSIALVLRHLPP
jgi:hypothetical protein